MVAWLSRLFEGLPGADQPAPTARQELQEYRELRRRLLLNIESLRAFGFDTQAREHAAALKSLDRRIQMLQLKAGARAPHFP